MCADRKLWPPMFLWLLTCLGWWKSLKRNSEQYPSRRKYLEENIAALDVELTREGLRLIDEVAPQGAAAGTRYPEAMMGMVNR